MPANPAAGRPACHRPPRRQPSARPVCSRLQSTIFLGAPASQPATEQYQPTGLGVLTHTLADARRMFKALTWLPMVFQNLATTPFSLRCHRSFMAASLNISPEPSRGGGAAGGGGRAD